MFCPKCGMPIDDGVRFCTYCGLDILSVEQEPKVVDMPSGEPVEENVSEHDVKKTGKQVIRFIYFGLAAVVLIMFFIASQSIISGGNEIMEIESVGGKTLEEAYYHELGAIYAGYAMIARAFGVFFASVLVWLGLKSK